MTFISALHWKKIELLTIRYKTFKFKMDFRKRLHFGLKIFFPETKCITDDFYIVNNAIQYKVKYKI